jgi:hypothetical protein
MNFTSRNATATVIKDNLPRCWTPYASWRSNVVTILTHFRRVVRSAQSRLRVPREHAESVLGHVRPGVQAIYDQHNFFAEKRDALIKWGTLLRSIVNSSPTTSNVITLRAQEKGVAFDTTHSERESNPKSKARP